MTETAHGQQSVPAAIALRRVGLRPSRQRIGLLELLQSRSGHHLTADEAFLLIRERNLRLPLGSLYNNLNAFAKCGLIRRITYGGKIWFCTNPHQHHHFINVRNGRFLDIEGRQPQIDYMPEPPKGYSLEGVDIFIRLTPLQGSGKNENDY